MDRGARVKKIVVAKKHSWRREEGEAIPGNNKPKRIRVIAAQKCSKCGQQGHNKTTCNNPSRAPVGNNPKVAGRPKNPATVHIQCRRKKHIKKVPNMSSQEGSMQPSQSKARSEWNDLGDIQRRRSFKNEAFFSCTADVPTTSNGKSGRGTPSSIVHNYPATQ